jgi:hypothetical protein
MKMKKILICILIIVLISWLFPFVKNEILTLRYGSEFFGLQKATNMIDDVKYLKVLYYSKEIARVYYFDIYGGDIIEFIKQDNKWEMNKWDTIWSKTGSADNFKWPYIYHSTGGKALLFLIMLLYLISIGSILNIVKLKYLKKIKQRNK